ncbi:MAG TPA: tRNA pseudouridine(38-40) synthase TruA [Thermoplasmatales archaeon]|nr:tRNA pseudouridine(38-40) synthase TruA [Thermoplasmatales archaeon]
MRYALKFAYDGSSFHGYARQPNLVTVEGEIIRTLQELNLIVDTKTNKFRSASRTDKGVSAMGNVVAFDCYYDLSIDVLKDLNKNMHDIWMYGIRKVKPGFHPRRMALLRHYRYFLKIKEGFDVDRFLETASLFTGEHNFKNFARIEGRRNPVRKIENIFVEEINEDMLAIDFLAPTFVWQQVRRIISAMYNVAMGKVDINDVEYALKNPDERRFFGIAPPENLILVDVKFDFEFEFDENFVKKAREVEEKTIKRAMTDNLDRRRFSCR